MFQRLKYLFKPNVKVLNKVEINQQYLLENLAYLQSLRKEDGIFPVLKANAYGHGIKEVSKILRHAEVPYICVDSFPEYQVVRDYAKKKVLVMGETLVENYQYYSPKWATLAVYNLQTIKRLISQRRHFTIHIFLNTGMNREGIQMEELEDALQMLSGFHHIQVEGVMSHLANAEDRHDMMSAQQIRLFKKMCALIQQYNFKLKRKCIGNSAGMTKIYDEFFNAWRSGIGFYGYNNLDLLDQYYTQLDGLQPALRVVSKIVSLQELKKGDVVGYGGTFTAPQDMHIGTIPFGYAEGLDKRVNDDWQIKWKNIYFKLAGAISMNYCSVDVDGNNIKIGDEVEIISRDKHAPNNIQHFAKTCNCLPYEVLVGLDHKMRREVV